MTPVSRRAVLAGGTATAAAVGLQPAYAATTKKPKPKPKPKVVPGTRVDVHAHAVPPVYRAALARHHVDRLSGFPVPDWSPAAAMAFMDHHGIQAQLVSIPDPGVSFVTDAAERRQLAQQTNNALHDLVHGPAGHGRFGAFAVLPLGPETGVGDVLDACQEATRAVHELGLDGIGIYSNYGTTYLGTPLFDPLVLTLGTLGVPVFVHSNAQGSHPSMDLPTAMLEAPFNTTRAMVAMSYLQVFTLTKHVRWIFADAGGVLPYLAYRTSTLEVYPALAQNLGVDALDHQNLDYGDLYYDTAWAPAAAPMHSLREVTSASHVLLGTDWPFTAPLFAKSGDPQPGLNQTFSPAERSGIDRHNTLALFPGMAARLGHA